MGTPAASTDLTTLTRALRAPQPASARADTLDAIRRLLPKLDPVRSTRPLADAVSHILRANPSNLLLAHRCVAILAHPALSSGLSVDRPILLAMDRLSMSAAFQHTAMAALQNLAAAPSHPTTTSSSSSSSSSVDRDALLLSVVSAMRVHHVHAGVLLRGTDLIAYHLNNVSPHPLTSTYRVASRVIIDSIDKLSISPQGASTALLSLVAVARHISSLAAFPSAPRPSPSQRFSRGASTASAILDHHFAYAVVLAMSRHVSYPSVQLLACELIRVAAAGATSVAKLAAKELFAAGAAAALVGALHIHPSDLAVVQKAVVALRSLLLGAGFHGRALKPGLHLDPDLIHYVATVLDSVADAVALKDRDLSSSAAVLAMDVRAAVPTSYRDPSDPNVSSTRLTDLGKRIFRRIRYGHRQNFYDHQDFSPHDFAPPSVPSSNHVNETSRRLSAASEFNNTNSHQHQPQHSHHNSDFQQPPNPAPPVAVADTHVSELGPPPSTTRHHHQPQQPTATHQQEQEQQNNHARDHSHNPDNTQPNNNNKFSRNLSDGPASQHHRSSHSAHQPQNHNHRNDSSATSDLPQIPLNRKWRSVSGRWNRGRRASIAASASNNPSPAVSAAAPASDTDPHGRGYHGHPVDAVDANNNTTAMAPPTTTRSTTTTLKRERRGPLTLSGSEMAHLTRQPSRVFGGGPLGELLPRKKDLRPREKDMSHHHNYSHHHHHHHHKSNIPVRKSSHAAATAINGRHTFASADAPREYGQ